MRRIENLDTFEDGRNTPVWNRREIAFSAAAVALLAGMLVPIPDIVLDILWVCVLSLTIAAATIFPAAGSTADLKGFAMLLIVPALLRIALVGSTGAKLLQNRSCGLLIPAVGKAVTLMWPLAAALAGLAAAVVLVGVLFAACQKIAAAGKRYVMHIGPLKCVGIKTDLAAGIISAEQAQTLADKIGDESRLFAQLSTASHLMRTEGSIEIAAMLVCLVGPFMGALSDVGSGTEQLAKVAASAVGLGIFSLLPAAFSALAAAYLAGKDSLTLRSVPEDKADSGRVFTLIDKTTGRGEEVELLNPDFTVVSSSHNKEATHEQLAEFEPQLNSIPIETPAFNTNDAHDYYHQLAGLISEAGTSRAILFAAANVRDLPVTVFVNTAIKLIQQGKKLLLIDADRQRNALAKVFDIPVAQLEQAVQKTAFEGLDIVALSGVSHQRQLLLGAMVQNDSTILAYAPNSQAWGALAVPLGTLEPTAFLFGFDGTTPPPPDMVSALDFCRRIIAVGALKQP
jgi:hypothetical protein